MMINGNLYELLLKLDRRRLLNLMLGALDQMQSYNGRSMTDCVCVAMEAEYDSVKDRYKIPSMAEIKRVADLPPAF